MASSPPVPFCVDLDGTLVRTDMLHETLLLLAKNDPVSMLSLPRWLAKGKSYLKHMVAERTDIDATNLPLNEEVRALIEAARSEGRPVVLSTAAPSRVASAVAERLGVFDAIISSSKQVNLSGRRKADALVDRFGDRGFDYIGNHRDDLAIFARARRGFLVSRSKSLRRAASRANDDITFIDDPRAGLGTWRRALRLHQWTKNGLIFVPLLAAQEVGNVNLLIAAVLAFISFSLCASTVYILNDLLDLAADRAHRSKYRRPFASGALPVASGVLAAPLLLVTSLLIALLLPTPFIVVLAAYGFATTAYSFVLKRQVIVDVMLLAGLYTTRILAGSAATGIQPSFWLLAFSMFLFFCLAMVKRYSELRLAIDRRETLAGRGYLATDLPVVLALGASSGTVSALVLALYTQSTIVQENFPHPHWLWVLPPLMLYWTSRLWLKASRGEVDDDPVVFATKDWQSIVVVVLMGAAFVIGGLG